MAGKKSKSTYIKNEQKKRKEETERYKVRSDVAGYSAQTLERYGIDSGKVLGNTAGTGSSASGSGSGRVKSSKEDFISAYRRNSAGMAGAPGSAVPDTASGAASDSWKRGILTPAQTAERGKGPGLETEYGFQEYASIPESYDYRSRVEAGQKTADRNQRILGAAMDIFGLALAGQPGMAASRRLRKSEERTAGQMDDDEAGIYAYLYDRYGMGAAEQYKDTIRDDLNRQYMEQLEGREKENAAKHPILSVGKDVYTAMQQPVEYIDSLGLGIAEKLTGRNLLDPNSPMFTATATTGAIREGINENEALKRVVPNDTVRGLLTGTGLSMAETLARLPMGNAGLVFAAGGAGSSAERDALQAGAGEGQALLRGAAQGTAEAAFEKVSLKGLEELLEPGTVTGARSFLKNMGKQATKEGMEEFATEAVNTATDELIMGGLSDYRQNVRNYRQEYIDQGMSEEEANRKAKSSARWDIVKNLGLATAGGALSGGIMGGGAQGLSLASEYTGGRTFNPDFRDYAQGIDSDAGDFTNAEDYWRARNRANNLQRTAEEYAARQANGETVPTILRGRFQNDLEGYVADVAGNQTRQQERQAQARTDAEEFVRQYRGRQAGNRNAGTAAGAVSAAHEGNTGTGAENGTAAAEAAQNGTQEPPVTVVDGRSAAEEVGRQAAEQMVRQEGRSGLQEETAAYAREQAAAGQQGGTVEPGQLTGQPEMAAGPVSPGYEGNTRVRAENGTGAESAGRTGLQEAAEQYARETAADRQRGVSRISDEQLDLYGEDYGTEGRKAFRDAYRMNEGTDLETYYRAFARQYNTGRYNMTLSAQNRAEVSAVLTQDQMDAAYRAGARDRNAEIGYDPDTYEMRGMRQGAAKTGGLAEASPLASDAQKQVADAIGKRTGLKFRITDDEDAAGGYRKGEVRISVNARNFLGTTSHELTHFIKEYSPDIYQMYEDRTLKYLSETDGVDLEKLVKSYQAGYEQAGQTLSREQAVEEIVADATERFLNDPEYIDRIVTENRSLGRKILDFINDVIDALKRLISTEPSGTKAARALESDLDHLEECREFWMQGLEEAGERYASGMELEETSEDTDERFKLARPDQVTDEQIEENYQAVREMEPVAELTGEEFAKDKGTLKEQVSAFYNSIGNMAYNDVVGEVILNDRARRADLAHGLSRDKAAAFRAVPDVIKNGHVLFYGAVDGDMRAVIGARIKIKGEDYYELCAAQIRDKNHMYLHEVCAFKTDENSPFWTKRTENKGTPSGDSHPTLPSIFKKLIFVNSKGENNETDWNSPFKSGSPANMASSTGDSSPSDHNIFPKQDGVNNSEGNGYDVTRTDGSLPIKTGAVRDGMPGEKSHLPSLSISDGSAEVNSKGENDAKGIRFQLEDVDDYEAQTRQLVQENEELREANRLLEKQVTLASRGAVREEDVRSAAGRILKKYDSEYDQGLLERNLGRLYEYIRVADRIDGDGLSAAAADIARGVLEASRNTDAALAEQYKDVRKQIRNTKLTISEKDRTDLAAAGGYNEFRKRYFGRIKLGNDGIAVDSLYMELADQYPEVFDRDVTHPADQLMQIASFIDATQEQVKNDYHADMEELSYIVGQELIEGYFDIQAPAGDGRGQQAGENLGKYRRLIDQYKDKTLTRYEALLAERDREMKGMSERHADELAAQRQKYEERFSRQRESQKRRETKGRIIKEVTTMRKWLLSPTDTKHIPQELRTVVADFLGSIDFSSKEDISGVQTQRTQAWQEAKNQFDRIISAGGMVEDDEGNVRYLDLDPDLQERFGGLMEKVKDLDKLENLDAYTLEELQKTVMSMRKAVTEVDAMKSNARYRKASLMADEVFQDLEKRKTKTEYEKWAGAPGRLMNYDMVDPLTMFGRIGPAFQTMYDSLRSGLDQKTRLLKDAEDYIHGAMQENGLTEKDIRKLTGMNAEVKEFELAKGKVRLSTAQIMSLYELDKRGQAAQHMYDRNGGIRPADRHVGFKVGKDGMRLPKTDKADGPVLVSREEVKRITDTLTPGQKKLADAMQRFMGETAAAWGNEVSMEMYGYEKFTARNYFPIRTDPNYNSQDENGRPEVTIKNLGITKSTNRHANNPIIIEDIFDVFTRQADQMSSYNAYVLPLSDLHKVLNYKDMRGNAGGASIQQEVQRVFGKDGKDYIDKLVKDINGSVQQEKGGFSDAMLSNFKAASVAGNLRVAIQQPTAIARAYAEIDLKYLAKGTAMSGKGKWDLICRYAPIAQWKDWGFYRMQTSRQMKDVLFGSDSAKQRFVNRTMVLAEKGDQVAWERLWNACEAECVEKYPDLEKGSEAFYQAVGKRFSGIVDRTQVADSILHRTQIMRSTNGLTKMATSFMAEPLKSYNMLYRAAMELNDAAAEIRANGKSEAGSRKETAAGRKLVRAGVAFVANAGLTALAASVMDATRDPDRDKDWLEKYQENVRQNFLDNLNMLNNIPYVKELPSIFKGYTPTRSDLSAFTDIYNVWRKLEKFFAGTSTQTFQSMIMETAQAASKLTGVPVKSIVRDAAALLDTAFNAAGGEADYQWLKQQYAIGAKGNRRMYADMILDSEERGDVKLAAKIREDMLEAGYSEEDIDDSINSAVNARINNDVDIIGAAEAYDANNKESVNIFKAEIDKYIAYKKQAGWDEEKCLKQIRTSLTNEYKPKWKEAKTQAEKDAVIKKCMSFYYNGDSIFKDYDFKKNWKDE